MTKTVADIITIGTGIGTSHAPDWPTGTVSDGWREVEWRNFGSKEEGRYFGGVWIGEPGTAPIDSMPYDEFCYLRSGSARFVDADGHVAEYAEGDGFLIPKGFSGHWEVVTVIEMAYVALGPF